MIANSMDMKPGRWWRAVGPDGKMHAESSDEQEIRGFLRPGDTLQRIYVYEVKEEEWRDESDDGQARAQREADEADEDLEEALAKWRADPANLEPDYSGSSDEQNV